MGVKIEKSDRFLYRFYGLSVLNLSSHPELVSGPPLGGDAEKNPA
jgi:hypothetical protein